jgi:hypothetical protein
MYSLFKTYKKIVTSVQNLWLRQGGIAYYEIAGANAKAPSNNGVLAATATSTDPTVVTTGFTAPSVPMNITATAGGTAADIKAVQVLVTGTNFKDEVITESLPAFIENTAGTVVGSKAFKTVTKIDIPAMDGAGATVAIGWGAKLGIPYALDFTGAITASLDGTADTVSAQTIGATVELNTFTLTTALNGAKAVVARIFI